MRDGVRGRKSLLCSTKTLRGRETLALPRGRPSGFGPSRQRSFRRLWGGIGGEKKRLFGGCGHAAFTLRSDVEQTFRVSRARAHGGGCLRPVLLHIWQEIPCAPPHSPRTRSPQNGSEVGLLLRRLAAASCSAFHGDEESASSPPSGGV